MTAISLAAAMRDPMLLGRPFEAESFWPWHAVAKVLSGERLDRREAALFRKCTGRTKALRKPVQRLFMLAGRRGGKDRFMSAVAVHKAALAADWRSILSPGEQGVVLLLGADKKQAGILRRYCGGLLESPLLAAEVVRDNDDLIEFRNGAVLEVATNDARLIRGRSAIAVLFSECCFWRTDGASASSDEEVVASAEPSTAMMPDPLLMLGSSPYRKRGLMHRKWKELFGNDDAEHVVWVAPSILMNPALPRKAVDEAMRRDPDRARAEYGGGWREDVAGFIPKDVIEGATDVGVIERPREDGAGYIARYIAFTDAAGGTGQDSFTLGIAHLDEGGKAVLDLVRERRPRFVPAAVVVEFAKVLRNYGLSEVQEDRYAAGWSADEWERNGIRYIPSPRTTSETYLAAAAAPVGPRAARRQRAATPAARRTGTQGAPGRPGIDRPMRPASMTT